MPVGTGSLGEDELWQKARDRTRQILNQLKGHKVRTGRQSPTAQFLGVRGVLGAEFTETERMQLIEYLKSL